MCSLRGECETSEGAGNKAGRMLAYNPSALRSLSSPTSGRRVGWVPHLGPPTAPVQTQHYSSQFRQKGLGENKSLAHRVRWHPLLDTL